MNAHERRSFLAARPLAYRGGVAVTDIDWLR